MNSEGVKVQIGLLFFRFFISFHANIAVSVIGRIDNPTRIIILEEVKSCIKSDKNRNVTMNERINNNPNTKAITTTLLGE
ncbi:hypothetical protein FNJ88_07055 [Chryseobacterium sp. SNU WT5]|uniref:hypothetical protein n=1 Tax=Chryseobacterium sp. SNU WT5 TaxID=2594269 RepID=UPI00117C4019|nr:hypothetical protein [Chryseobacterium sp. SNU WT5]QDP85333.1 hypothetical protein FNJ88_07055 [Chryseobacterium sp. SNU WT5]